jgi:hypothetical protein
MFDLVADAVGDALEAEIELEPEHDARLTGCDRRTLWPDPAMGAHLCYLADTACDASTALPGAALLPPSDVSGVLPHEGRE